MSLSPGIVKSSVSDSILDGIPSMTRLSPTSTSSSTPTSSAYISPISSSPPNSDVGTIAGVAVGCSAIVAIVVSVLYLRRRKHKRASSLDPNLPATDIIPTRVAPKVTESVMASTAPTAPLAPLPSVLLPKRGGSTHAPPAPDQFENQLLQPSMPEQSLERSSQELPTFTPSHQMYRRLLTDEQADFVNDLQRGNVPSGTILHIMERMHTHQEPGTLGVSRPGSFGGPTVGASTTSAPPSYASEERTEDGQVHRWM